jgi:hypothetical protein
MLQLSYNNNQILKASEKKTNFSLYLQLLGATLQSSINYEQSNIYKIINNASPSFSWNCCSDSRFVLIHPKAK